MPSGVRRGALTEARCHVPFTDIGAAVMKGLADTQGIKIDDGDKKELTEKFSTIPPHPEVQAALSRLLADVRDESTEDVRLILEPKTRNVDAEMLMEQLFRLTELETRVPLNLNVLDPFGVPRVMNLKEALQAFLDHRRVVLLRRSRHRLAAVARRMEILRGQIIVYLNLDEVIRIIREDDDPKAQMMARWDLGDVQVEAILNMRL